ncbi:MAG: hypothetical protein QOI26_752 [Pseudonocardiales bacterium]|nr:hypothetical protein [Pseudonocardiales bacterium]
MALAELMAARNCRLQSEKAMLTGCWCDDELADDELAEAELLAVELAVLTGGAACLIEVHAVPPSSTAAATASTDGRVARRVNGTC